MKKFIALALVAIVGIAAFFAMEHFNGTTQTTVAEEAAVNATTEVTLPEITLAPTATPEPKVEATVAPTEGVATIYLKTDAETGKVYYEAESQQIVLDYVRESVNAADAVDAIECVNYGASMVVSHDDPRIIGGLTAYDLITDEDELVVEFDRNAGKLYVYSTDEDFDKSEKVDKTFKGMNDSKAYSTWICSEHGAFKASALAFEGYPESEGFRGTFKVADGFSAKVLKSIVLINTEDNRYDWVMISCECKDVVKQPSGNGGGNGGNGGNGGGSKPTNKPTQQPTQQPEHAPEATLPPKATAEPEHAPEKTLPPKQEPTVTRAPELGNPEHKDAGELPAKKEEASDKKDSAAHVGEQKAPEKKNASTTEKAVEAKAEATLPPKKSSTGSNSSGSSSGESAPALGGVKF